MTTILGIDCAVDPRRRGIARGTIDQESGRIDAAWRGDRVDLPELVAEALGTGPVLLALDAPLGWPRPLAEALVDHRAGRPLPTAADALFRRHTDREIARRLRKTPMDVGADRIARTAEAALRQLGEVAAALDRPPLPLLWTPARPPRLSAVEVYPAGLLVAGGFPLIGGYKPASARPARQAILARLAEEIAVDGGVGGQALADADILDALLCVLAGWDVLRGRAVAPRPGREAGRARREGWIWVRDRLADDGAASR